jgi:hypothetical protein
MNLPVRSNNDSILGYRIHISKRNVFISYVKLTSEKDKMSTILPRIPRAIFPCATRARAYSICNSLPVLLNVVNELYFFRMRYEKKDLVKKRFYQARHRQVRSFATSNTENKGFRITLIETRVDLFGYFFFLRERHCVCASVCVCVTV